MNLSTLEALVALNQLPKIGPIRIRRLIHHFGHPAAALHATGRQLEQVEGIGPDTARILRQWQDHSDPVAELRTLREHPFQLLTHEDPRFPPHLLQTPDAPVLLYVWGDLLPEDRHAIAVVGTRRATRYGLHATRRIVQPLARAGFTILSGLARGIDTCAHQAALDARGRTVAVIGSGLLQLFPAENRQLAEQIASGRGAVVSEFPLHTPPDTKTFPQRNRIVAAWSQALIVTESPSWSGSLITAQLANDYGRHVYAVPGPIDQPTSAGCHQLIRDGATLLTEASELLDDLSVLPLSPVSAPAPPATPAMPDLPPDETSLLGLIDHRETTIDTLVELSGLPVSQVSTTLLKLEMKRHIRALPGFRYCRRS